MTVEQTRQLGIEFERRVQIMNPDAYITDKLDTDTIYAILSEYQNKYIRELYLTDGQTETGSRPSKKINETLHTLVRHKTICPCRENIDSDRDTTLFHVPEDYYLYIRSNSIINKNYKQEGMLSTETYTPNMSIKHDDAEQLVGRFYDQKRIMRNPAILFESVDVEHPYFKVIHDQYTNIIGLDLVYICQPYAFNVLNYDDDDMSQGAVHSYCELPFSCFDELVNGAVEFYTTSYKYAISLANKKATSPRIISEAKPEQK